MEVGPPVEVIGLAGTLGEDTASFVGWLEIGVMISGVAMNTVVVLLEVEQLSPDHLGSEIKEVAD